MFTILAILYVCPCDHIKLQSKQWLDSDWIVRTEQQSFSGSLVLSMSAVTNYIFFFYKQNSGPPLTVIQ